MILNSNHLLPEKTNKQIINRYFPKSKAGARPHFLPLDYKKVIYIWFNYEAIFSNGKYLPGNDKNKFINIYRNDEIEEIAPSIEKANKIEGKIRIVFKKNNKNNDIYFMGVYKLYEIQGRTRIYKKISDTFDTNNPYSIYKNNLNILLCNIA